MAPNFDRFESIWLQHVGVLQEKVYKIHITEWTETATDNGVGQDCF